MLKPDEHKGFKPDDARPSPETPFHDEKTQSPPESDARTKDVMAQLMELDVGGSSPSLFMLSLIVSQQTGFQCLLEKVKQDMHAAKVKYIYIYICIMIHALFL